MSSYIWTTPEDVQKVVDVLEAQRGPSALAMLYNEHGLAETDWNLIVAARWAEELGGAEATKVVTHALSQGLGMENRPAISRVTILPTSDRFVREVTSLYPVVSPGGGQWIQNTSAAGIPIGAGFIFYSRVDKQSFAGLK